MSSVLSIEIYLLFIAIPADRSKINRRNKKDNFFEAERSEVFEFCKTIKWLS